MRFCFNLCKHLCRCNVKKFKVNSNKHFFNVKLNVQEINMIVSFTRFQVFIRIFVMCARQQKRIMPVRNIYQYPTEARFPGLNDMNHIPPFMFCFLTGLLALYLWAYSYVAGVFQHFLRLPKTQSFPKQTVLFPIISS